MKSIHNKAYQCLLQLLRRKRTEQGVTQQELASRLNVGQGIVSKIETHERRLDLIELREICIALGISFPEFVNEFDEHLKQEEDKEHGEN